MVGLNLMLSVQGLGDNSVEKAQRLYARIAGVKLNSNSPILAEMASLIEQKRYSEAANKALDSNDYYNISLFQYFAPLSNRAEVSDVSLNDFIVMGIANTFTDPATGKDRPYTNLVDGDFRVQLNNQDLASNNNTALTNAFNARTILTPLNLTIVTPQRVNFPDAAGLLTTRQFLQEHATAGTNRRLVHYAFREFLCTDIKEWRDADLSISDEFVTRDVNRSPGGGAAGFNQYQTECRTCHQVQDSLRNAFAYHDFVNNAPVYMPGRVAPKINRNIEFQGGFVVQNDSWENKATRNGNANRFGWRGPLTGNGAKSLGAMIAKSERFASCAVERVFKHVCLRAMDSSEGTLKQTLARNFEADGYSLRGLFRSVALSPSCLQVGE